MGVGLPQSQRPPIGESDAGRWPARTQRLLGEVRTLCETWLHGPLMLCLGDFDRRLYEKSDRTRSHLDQQRYLATRQCLLQGRQTFEGQFIAHIERAFTQMGTVRAPATPPPPRLSLSLLDPLEHELTTALDQLVARNEARSGPLLVELSYRLAVLMGMPPLEPEALPVGPQAIAAAFRDASAALKLPSDHHLLLLQSLEGTLIQGLAPLYEIINHHLLADGILPRLRAFPLPRSTPRGTRVAKSVTTPAATSAAAPDQAAATTAAPNAPARSQPAAATDPLRQRPHATQAHDTTPVATPAALQTALAAVQQQLTPADGQIDRMLCDARTLRDKLLAQLNCKLPADAARTQLGTAQEGALERLTHWFERLDQQLPLGDPAHALLGDLQLPLLRMALADRDFFEQRDHPAQQLLDKAIEVAHDWLGDSDNEAERSLRAQLRHLTDRASNEPPSTTLYTHLLVDIDRHLSQLTRRAQLAERRLVEATQGRERLELARRRGAELLAERFASTPPRGLLRGLLEHAWSDVLALTLLQHGEHSEAFSNRMVITDQLLGRLPAGDRRKLQVSVETGLQQIGMSIVEAQQLAQRLLGSSGDDADAELPSATDLALRLQRRQRLGEPSGVDANPVDHPLPPANPREQRIQQHLRTLPFDSWFEFSEAATGRSTRRKLVWYSTASERCLLVNRRGQRSTEMNLPQLAHEIASGRARELPQEQENPLDRAWRSVDAGPRAPSRPSRPAAGR
jgi:hypothetical protein